MLPALRLNFRFLPGFAAMVFAALSPASAEVRTVPDELRGAAFRIIISGPIDLFTLYGFAKVIIDSRIAAGRAPFVELNSPGGSVTAAIAIGQLIRDRGFDTGVNRQQECHSACVLILAAGVQRTVGSAKVGIHRPHMGIALLSSLSRQQARETYDQISEDMRTYLKRMGMSEHLYPAMLKVPSDRIRVLSLDEMQAFGLVEKNSLPAAAPVAMDDRDPRVLKERDFNRARPPGMKHPEIARGLSSSRRRTRAITARLPGQWGAGGYKALQPARARKIGRPRVGVAPRRGEDTGRVMEAGLSGTSLATELGANKWR